MAYFPPSETAFGSPDADPKPLRTAPNGSVERPANARPPPGWDVLAVMAHIFESSDGELVLRMNTRTRGLTGVGIVGATVSLLANVGGAHSALVTLWPALAALSPVLASGLLLVGLTLVGEVAWRWHAPRRPTERFRGLAPQLQRIATAELSGDKSEEQLVAWRSDHHGLTLGLRALGVSLPFQKTNVQELFLLSAHGQLREARKQFPPDFDDCPF